jgi:hypothetical protein
MRNKRNRTPSEYTGHGCIGVLSWPVIEKGRQGVVFPSHSQEKPCCCLEMDSETQTEKKKGIK